MSNSYLKAITKNVISQVTGQLLSLLLTLISLVYAARFMGVEEFGVFNSLLAFIVIITKIVDLGIAPNIFREYSLTRDFSFISTGISLRSLCLVILVIFYNALSFFLHSDLTEIMLANVLFVNLLISSKGFVREILEVPFKESLAVHFPVALMLIDNFIFLVLVCIMPVIGAGLFYFIIAYTFSNLPGFIFMIVLIRKKYNYRFSFKTSSVQWLIKNSLPLYIYVVLNTAFLNIDLLLLKVNDNLYSAGIYSAATRITIPLLIIPTALIHSLYPQIIKNYQQSSKNNIPIIKFLFKIFFLISFGLSVIIGFKSKEVIELLYGIQYLDSSNALVLLLWSQIFMFYSFFVINILVAYNRQRSIYLYSVITLIINIGLNYLLIPEFHYMGAAYAKLISLGLGFLMSLVVIYRVENTVFLFEKKTFYLSATSLIVIYLFTFLNLALYFIVTVFAIIAITFFLKYFNSYEIKALLKLINRESWYNSRLFVNYTD